MPGALAPRAFDLQVGLSGRGVRNGAPASASATTDPRTQRQPWTRIFPLVSLVCQITALLPIAACGAERLGFLRTAQGLRLSIACSNAFPGYLVAASDSFCCISAHACRLALPLVRSTVDLCDCLFDCVRLLEWRGSAGFGAAFGGDVACG